MAERRNRGPVEGMIMVFAFLARTRLCGGVRLAGALAIAAAVSCPAAAVAGDIYLATNGNDAHEGISAKTPVATLGAAVQRAIRQSARTGEDATILVAPGIYRGQTVALDARQMKGALTITGASRDPGNYPAFYGDGTGTWLRYDGSAGQSTGLAIRNLRIVDYSTAITLNGNRDDPRGFNRGTIIAGNIFTRIGSDSSKGRGASTAALRLVNSRDNAIENNWFKTIRNYPATACPGLHAIYVAHRSTGNHIVGNSFDDFCGSAIKLRDGSNDNMIKNNRFRTRDKAPGIEEWYCDLAANDACTKQAGECPSVGNLVSGNRFGGIDKRRRVSARGNRQQRPWCRAEDYARPRFSGNNAPS